MGDKRSHWAFDVLQNTPAFHLLLWPKLIFTCSWVWRWNFILISIHKYIHIYIHTYIFINPRSHVTITAISKRKTIKSNYSLWTNRHIRHLYTSNFNHLCGHILTLILSHKSFKRWSSHLCVRYLTLWIKSVNYSRKKDRIFLSDRTPTIFFFFF